MFSKLQDEFWENIARRSTRSQLDPIYAIDNEISMYSNEWDVWILNTITSEVSFIHAKPPVIPGVNTTMLNVGKYRELRTFSIYIYLSPQKNKDIHRLSSFFLYSVGYSTNKIIKNHLHWFLFQTVTDARFDLLISIEGVKNAYGS